MSTERSVTDRNPVGSDDAGTHLFHKVLLVYSIRLSIFRHTVT